MSKKKYIPKYPIGGQFWKKAGQFGSNMLKADANSIAGVFGDKPYNDEDFHGYGANIADGIGNTIGNFNKSLAPIAANTLAPGAGSALSIAQGYGNMNQSNQPNYGQMAQLGMQMAQMFAYGGDVNHTQKLYDRPNYSTPHLFKYNMGGFKYANGGTGEPSAEVEKQENSISPNGEFTQYNGPSHEQGGITTDLADKSIIFSDRLKPQSMKKTYAQLNKPNNTNKENKILDNNSSTSESRKTAELMKKVKQTNSQELFKDQEAQKAFNFDSGLYKYGGAVSYKNGGIHIKSSTKRSFTRWAKSHGMGVQEAAHHVMAHKDNYSSSIVKKANFAKNAANFKHAEGGILNNLDENISNKVLVNGLPYQFPGGGKFYGNPNSDQSNIQAASQDYLHNPNYLAFKDKALDRGMIAQPGDPNMYRSTNFTNFDSPFGQIPVATSGTKMKYNPYSNYLPQGQKIFKYEFRNGGVKSDIQSDKLYKNMYSFKKGDNQIYSPYRQYPIGGPVNPFEPQGFFPQETGYPEYITNQPSQPGVTPMNVNDAQFNFNKFKLNKPNQNMQNRNSNIGNTAYYGLGTLAQSAGPLTYLAQQGKRYDTQKYYNYNPTKLDPSSALRDADIQSKQASYDLANASGGNSGSYLGNRIALSAQNTLNKADIRSQYDNMNAGISNQAQQFNIGNQYRTNDINAMRKGQALTNYYQSIGALGDNAAMGMRDMRADKFDQERMGYLPYMYNNPEFNKLYPSKYRSK